RDVALAGRRPADDADRQEHVGWARGADARTHLVSIADVARTRPADGAGIARRVLAGVVRAVAQISRADVAVVGARRARRRLRVGRAGGTAPRAEVVLIAVADRRTAVDRARLEQIVRARAREARAELGQVARAGGGATGRAGVDGRMLAGVARPVARVAGARIAVVGARRPARLLGVGRAAGAVARAEVVGVALVHRGATEHGRGLEGVVRTRRAAA